MRGRCESRCSSSPAPPRSHALAPTGHGHAPVCPGCDPPALLRTNRSVRHQEERPFAIFSRYLLYVDAGQFALRDDRWSWVGTPGRKAVMQSPTGPKVYPKVPKHVRVWGGPVEPAAVVVKVEAPLNGRACGWACLGSYDPAIVPEDPIGLMKFGVVSHFTTHEPEVHPTQDIGFPG